MVPDKLASQATFFFPLILLIIGNMMCSSCSTHGHSKALQLWYDEPADEWMEALPVGNGRLGAMIFGKTNQETIALNEITMWNGSKEEADVDCGREKLDIIRKLFYEGRLDECHAMANEYLTSRPSHFGTHLPVGDLNLHFFHDTTTISEYKRILDIEKALVSITYQVGDTLFRREIFCSNPDQVLVIRLSSDKKQSINVDASYQMLRQAQVRTGNSELYVTGQTTLPGETSSGVNFAGQLRIKAPNGTLSSTDTVLQVRQADEVLLCFDLNTDYTGADPESTTTSRLNKAIGSGYSTLLKKHTNDYTTLFDRVSISLGKNNSLLPTDVRQKQMAQGKQDPALTALFLQYGRYLAIASSRESSPLPSNLQGVWNDNLACNMGWNCDYNLDINIQQNYWPNNVCNLAECNTPLIRFLQTLVSPGNVTAKNTYSARGWVAHTLANGWGATDPANSINWSMFPTAGAWLASHLSEHYRFTRDTTFYKQTAYPVLQEAARFFLDYMFVNPGNGFLMTGPCISPENAYKVEGKEYVLSMMPTCDIAILQDLFSSIKTASEEINLGDKAFIDSVRFALKRLPPLQIGRHGQLQEWFDDYDEAAPNHRHTSHLLALYPYRMISLEQTPKLAQAAEVSINRRLNADGWEDVEFSRANMIAFYARLKNQEKAYQSVVTLQTHLSRENLLTISPKGIGGAPWDIFMLDGNMAGTAGIAEMLIQSQEGYIEFLPCLPEAWKDGEYKGLCVRGGAEAGAMWKNSLLHHATLKATAYHTFNIKLPDDTYLFSLNKKKINLPITEKLIVSVEMKKGDLLTIDK